MGAYACLSSLSENVPLRLTALRLSWLTLVDNNALCQRLIAFCLTFN